MCALHSIVVKSGLESLLCLPLAVSGWTRYLVSSAIKMSNNRYMTTGKTELVNPSRRLAVSLRM